MICKARSVRSSVGFKISARVRQSAVTSNTLWANLNFLGRLLYKDILFLCPRWSSGPYMTLYILKKIGLTLPHVLYNSRKLVNVVKVRFTMMYSSRKLNNKKVITTASNFWRQIACSFQVYGRTNHHNFCAKSTWKKRFWISRFFHPTNIDVTSCFYRQFFRPLYEDKGKKITIFNCEYLRDACFNWAETS